ncbi:L-seryl-tRNA(Sec) selenium transferase [Campylobacter sp. RM9333]|uniref:L-seryl-tRNA(Sec) selenium transferase n=1 Tax=Campylobacter sp. RM9333 TaxID=2735731 RepID=UPI001DEFCC3D|nr:L-seryl-tRNA(Sec) selenium transferase [Campylobacter sp. RM9333]
MLPQISKLINAFNDKPSFLVSFLAKELINELRATNKEQSYEMILKELNERINKRLLKEPRALINATGVVLHTNLGRALMSESDYDELKAFHTNNINLEFDLESNARGKRDENLIFYLKMLFGCEDALVVNNNAAAVFLVLNTLGKNEGVITSRAELVEIGGGFRVSDVMRESGARLIEVGTTNKTKMSDYEAELNNAKMILKTHKSNFYIGGFSQEVDAISLNDLACKNEKIFYYDLGSGYVDLINDSLKDEPSVKSLISKGISLVSFSGDKLFSSTQAGIILGKKELIEKLRKNQLLRMFRLNKTSLLILTKAVKNYLNKDYANLPSLALLNDTKSQVLNKAKTLQELINFGEIVESKSLVGGGSMPEKLLSGYALKIKANKCKINELLNKGVVANYDKDSIIIDLRSVLPNQLECLANIIKEVLKD